MARNVAGGMGKWALTGVIVLIAALAFWWVQSPAGGDDKDADGRGLPVDADTRIRVQSIALRYAQAVESGDCDTVVDMTGWMRQRLSDIVANPSEGETPEKVRDELCALLQDRSLEGNRIRPEGVEDRYVFAPGVQLEPLKVDRGREDLSSPVLARAWLRVTYPNPNRALCDEQGRAIRSMTVGVNVSPDGYVVKSGVIGNLDISSRSISYDGDARQGG